jgi:uncharacterized RDD family membrane protein YckC
MRYFIGKDGKQLGPFNDEQVRAKLASGEVSYDDLGWHEGMPEWKPLRALFPATSASTFPTFNPPPAGNAYAPFNPAAADASEFVPSLASRGSRLGAVLLDQLFVLILLLPGLWQLLQPFMKDMQAGRSPTPEEIVAQLAPALPLLIIPILVFVIVQIVLLVKHGQTVGKKLLGIRIVKLNGSNPGFVSVIIMRSFLPGLIGGIPAVGPFFSLVNVLLIFREDRRCIHDLMAGTIVVEA